MAWCRIKLFGMDTLQTSLAEEALSLSPSDRVGLVKLLVQSLEGDARPDQEVRDDLNRRLQALLSGEDPGLSFEQVFGRPL